VGQTNNVVGVLRVGTGDIGTDVGASVGTVTVHGPRIHFPHPSTISQFAVWPPHHRNHPSTWVRLFVAGVIEDDS
jgi:hypothetical protein